MAVATIRRSRPFSPYLEPSRVYARSPYRPYVGTMPSEQSAQARLLDEQMARAVVSPFQINDPNVMRAIRRTRGIESDGSYEIGQQIGASVGFVAGSALAYAMYAKVAAGHLATIAAAASSTGVGVPVGAMVGLVASALAITGTVMTSTKIGKTVGAVVSKEGQIAWGTYLSNVGNSFTRRPITAVLNTVGTFAIPVAMSKVPFLDKVPGATTIATMYAHKYTSILGNKIDAGLFGELDEKEMMSYTDFRSLRGDLTDSFQGNNIVKAVLASIPGEESVSDLIARSYGESDEGYSPLGFNKVREAYGVDFGIFANGLIDMLGEISINTNRWIRAVNTPIKDAISKHFKNSAILTMLTDKSSALFKHFFEIDKNNKVIDKKFNKDEVNFEHLGTSIERIVDRYKDPNLARTKAEKQKIERQNNQLIFEEATRLANQKYITESKKINLIQNVKESAKAKENLTEETKQLNRELVKLFSDTLNKAIKPIKESNQSLLEIDQILAKILDSDKKKNEFNFDLTLLKEIKDNNFLMNGQLLQSNLKTNSLLRHQLLANQSFYSVIDYLANPTLKIMSNKHVSFALRKALQKLSNVNDPIKVNTTMKKLIKEEADIDKFQQEFEEEIEKEIKTLNDLINASKDGKKEEFLEKYFLDKYKMPQKEYLESLNKKLNDPKLSKEQIKETQNLIKQIENEYKEISANFNDEETLKQFQSLLKTKQDSLDDLRKTINNYKKEINGFMYVSSDNKRIKINTKEEKEIAEKEIDTLTKTLEVEKNILKDLVSKGEEKNKKSINEKHRTITEIENEISEFKNLISLYEFETMMGKVIKQNMKNLMSINNRISFFETNMLEFKNKLLELTTYMKYIVDSQTLEVSDEKPQTADKSKQTTLEKAKFQRDTKKEKMIKANGDFFKEAFGVLELEDFKAFMGGISTEETEDLEKLKTKKMEEFSLAKSENEKNKIAEQLVQIEAQQTFLNLMNLRSGNEIEITMSYGRSIIEHLEISGSETIEKTIPNNILFLNELNKLFTKDSELIKKISVFKGVYIGKSKKIKLDGRSREVKELKSLLQKEITRIIDEDSNNEILTKEEGNSIKEALITGKGANENLNGIVKSFILMASRNNVRGKEIHEPSRIEKGFNNSRTLFNAFLNEMFFKTVKGRGLLEVREQLEKDLKNFRQELSQLAELENFSNGEKNLIRSFKYALSKISYSDFVFGLNYKYFTGSFQEEETRKEKYRNEIFDVLETDLSEVLDENFEVKVVSDIKDFIGKLSELGVSKEIQEDIKYKVDLIVGDKLLTGEEPEVEVVDEPKTEVEQNVEKKSRHMEDVIRLLTQNNPSMTREQAATIYGELLDAYESAQKKLSIKKEVEQQLHRNKQIRENKIENLNKELEQDKLEGKDIKEIEEKEKVLKQLEKETSSLKKVYKGNKIMQLVDIEDLHNKIIGKTKKINTRIDVRKINDLDKQIITEKLNENVSVLEKVIFLKSLKGHTFQTSDGIFINIEHWKQLSPEFRSQFLDMERMSSEELSKDENEQVITFFKGKKVESMKDEQELIKTNSKIKKLEKQLDLEPSKDLKDKLDKLYARQLFLEERIKDDKAEINLNKNRVPKYIQNIFESSYSTIKQINNLKDVNKIKKESIEITKDTKLETIENKLSRDIISIINSRGNIKVLSITDATYKDIYFKDKEVAEMNVDVLEIQVGQNKFEIFVPKEENGIFTINGNKYFRQKTMGEDENSTDYLEHLISALEKEIKLFSKGYSKKDMETFGINYGQSKMQEALMKVFFRQRSFYNEEEAGEYITDFKYIGNNTTEEALNLKLNSMFVPKYIRNKLENRKEDYIKHNADFKSTNATGNSAQLNVEIEGKWVTPLEIYIPAYKQLNSKNYHRISSSMRALANSQKLKSGLNENPLFMSKNYKYANIEKGNGINLKVKLDDFYGTYTLKNGEKISLSTTNDMSIMRMSAAKKIYGDENGNIDYSDISYLKMEDRYSNKSTTLVLKDDEFDQIFGEGHEMIMSKSSNLDRQSQGQLIEMAFNERALNHEKFIDEKGNRKEIEYDNDKDVYENWKEIFGEEITEDYLNSIVSGHQYFYLVEDTYNPDDDTEKLEPKVTGDQVSTNSSAISFEVMSTIAMAQNTKVNGKAVDPEGSLLEWLTSDPRTRKDMLTLQELHERSLMLEGSGGRIKQEAMKYHMPNSLDDKLTADPSLKDRQMSVTKKYAEEMGLLNENGEQETKEAIFIRYPMKGRDSIVHVEIVIRKEKDGDNGKIGVSESYTKLTNTDFDGDRGTLFALKGADEKIINISKQLFTHDYLINKDFSDFQFEVNQETVPSSLKITKAKANAFAKAYGIDYLNKISTNWSEELDENGNKIKLTQEERDKKIFEAKTIQDKDAKVEISFDETAQALEDSGLRSHKVKEYAAKNQHLVDDIASAYLLDDKFNFWFENVFLKDKKLNILGVTDIASITNLAREFLGQDAFDFAKRGAEDSKLLDKMYELVGPFFEENADKRQAMVKLQFLLLSIGTWKLDEEVDKKQAKIDFEERLKEIKGMTFVFEDTEFDKFQTRYGEKEKPVLDLTDEELSDKLDPIEESFKKAVKRMSSDYNLEEEQVDNLGLGTKEPKADNKDEGIFKVDYNSFRYNKEKLDVLETISKKATEEEWETKKGFLYDPKELYFKRITQVLKKMAGELNKGKVSGDDVQIIITYQNGETKKVTLREAFQIKSGETPSNIIALDSLFIKKDLFENAKEGIETIHFESTNRIVGRNYLNNYGKELFRGISEVVNVALQNEGKDGTIKLNPRVYSQMYHDNGYVKNFYLDLIRQEEKGFRTAMGAVNNMLAKSNPIIKEDLLKTLRPFITNTEMVNFLALKGEKALLLQHYQEALFIKGIFDEGEDSKKSKGNLSFLSLGSKIKSHSAINMKRKITKILKEEYKNRDLGEFNFDEEMNGIISTAQKLLNPGRDYVKSEAYQNLTAEKKANLIAKLFMIKKFKGDLKEFKELGMGYDEFINVNTKTSLDSDFSNIFFAAYEKTMEAVALSKTKDKYSIEEKLRKEHESFGFNAKQIKITNELLSAHHFDKKYRTPTNQERIFQITKSKEAKMIYDSNVRILKTFKKFEDSGSETDFTKMIYNEWKDVESTDLTTLDHSYKKDPQDFITYLEEQAINHYSKKVVNTLIKVNKLAKAFGHTNAVSLSRLVLNFDTITKNSPLDSYEKVSEEEQERFLVIREAQIYNYVANNLFNSENGITEEQQQAINELVRELSSFDANTRGMDPTYLAHALLGKMIFDRDLYDDREVQDPKEINKKMDTIIEELKTKKDFIDSIETDNLSKEANDLVKEINEQTDSYKIDEKSFYNNILPKEKDGRLVEGKFKKDLDEAINNYLNREKIDNEIKKFDTYTTAKHYTEAFKYTQSNIFWNLISTNTDSLEDPELQPILSILKEDAESLRLFNESLERELTEEELSKVNAKTQEAIIKATEKYILKKIENEDKDFHDKIKNKKLHSAIIDARLNMEVFKLMANKFGYNEDGSIKSVKELSELFNSDVEKAEVLHKFLNDQTSVIFFDTENLLNRNKNIYEISYITIDADGKVIYNQELIPSSFEGATKDLYKSKEGFNFSEEEIKQIEESLMVGPWDSSRKAFENFFKAAKGKALVGQAIESEAGKSGDIERLNNAYERVMKNKIKKTLEKHHPRYEELRKALKEAESKENIDKLDILKKHLNYNEETGKLLTTSEVVRKTFEVLKEMNLENYKEFLYINGDGERTELEQDLYLEELTRLQYPFFSSQQYNNSNKLILSELISFGLTKEQAQDILDQYNQRLADLIEIGVLNQKIHKMYLDPKFGLTTQKVDSEIISIKYKEGDFVSEAFFRQEAFNLIAPELLKLAKFKNDKRISVKEGLRIHSFGTPFYNELEKHDLNRSEFSPKINLLIGAAKEEYVKTNDRIRYLISLKQIEKEFNKENKGKLFEGYENIQEFSKALNEESTKQDLIKRINKFTMYEIKDQIIKKSIESVKPIKVEKDESFIMNVKAFGVRLLNYGNPNDLTVDLFREILKLDPSVPEEIIQNELTRFQNNFNALVRDNIKDRFEILNQEYDGELLKNGEDIIYEEGLIGTFMETALWQTIGMESTLSYLLEKTIKDFKDRTASEKSEFDLEIEEANSVINNKKVENENNKELFKEQRDALKDFLLNKDEESLINYFKNSPKYKNENEAMYAYRKFKTKFESRLTELKKNGFYTEAKEAHVKDGRLNSRKETKTKIEYIENVPSLERAFLQRAIKESWEEINEELYTNKIHKTIDPYNPVDEKITYSFYNKNIEKFDGSYEKADFEYEDKLINNIRKAHQKVYRKQYQYQNLTKYQYNFFDMIGAFKDHLTGEYNKEALLEALKFGFLGQNYKITFITKMNRVEKENYKRKVLYDKNATLEKYRSELTDQEQKEFDTINSGLEPLVDNIYETDVPTMKVINISNMNDLDNLLKLAERGEVGFTTNFDMISAQKMMNNGVRLSPVLNFIHNTVNFVQKSLMLANPMFLINIATNAVKKNYESLLRQGKLIEGTGRYMSEFGKAAEMDLIYKKHSMVNEKVLKEFRTFTEDISDPSGIINMLDNQIASIEDYLSKNILEDNETIENLMIIRNKLRTYKAEFENTIDNEVKIAGVFNDYVNTYTRAGFISKMVINGYRQDSNLMAKENEDIISEIEKAKFVNDIYKHNIIYDPYEIETRKNIKEIQKALDNEIHNSFKHNTIINGVQTITKGAVKPMRYLTDWINRTSRIHSVALEMSVGNTEVEAYNKTLKKFFNYGEKGALEKEATVFFPFMSYAIRNLDYYLDLVNDPRYMDLMSDIAQGMRTWYSVDDDYSTSNFSNHFAMQRGWIPLGENYGIKLTDQMLNANKFITDTGNFINARRNPLINGIQSAIRSEDENFDLARSMGFNSSFYGGGVQALNNIAGNTVETPADLFPNVFYADNYTKYTPYKYRRRQRYGDYRNLTKDLFFPDGTRRIASRNPHTTAKNILYKNFVNERLMKKYRREL